MKQRLKEGFGHSRWRLVSSVLLGCWGLTACAGGSYEPFAGSSWGPNKGYAAAVEALTYNYESVLQGSSAGGGCIPNTSGIDRDRVGKKRYGGGSTCGATSLPAKWRPGLTIEVFWRIAPYPDFRPRGLNVPGVVFNQEDVKIIRSYNESYRAVVPLPPPPARVKNNFGRVSNVTVHFLACNQLFITYGTEEEDSAQGAVQQMALFKKSEKLCQARPFVKSAAYFWENRGRLQPLMDKVRAERLAIKQVILPEYMAELERTGQIPRD